MSELFSAITAGLGGMFGWAFADFYAAKAMQKISPVQTGLWLYACTSAVLWLIVFATGQSFSPLNFSILVQLIVFAVINVAAYLLFYKALQIGTLSTISTIFSTYAVGATILSILFFGETTNTIRIIALLIVFVGIVGVSISDIKTLKIIKGFQWVILAALLLALFFPFWDQFLGNNSGGGLFWVALADSFMVILFFAYLAFRKPQKAQISKSAIPLILGGLANALAVAATTLGFEATSLTSVIVVVSSAVPLVSSLLGYFLLKEKLIKTQYLGIAAILVGTVLLFGT